MRHTQQQYQGGTQHTPAIHFGFKKNSFVCARSAVQAQTRETEKWRPSATTIHAHACIVTRERACVTHTQKRQVGTQHMPEINISVLMSNCFVCAVAYPHKGNDKWRLSATTVHARACIVSRERVCVRNETHTQKLQRSKNHNHLGVGSKR